MPRLLLDTACDALVVALASPDRLLAERVATGTRAQELLRLIDEVLHEAGAARSDLEDVAVGTGPGAFTGLRVGVATARGIAEALGVPLAPLSTLAAIAWPRAEELGGPVWAHVDAKRGERFARRYRRIAGVAGFSMVADSDLHVVAASELDALVGDEPCVEGPPLPAGLWALAALAPFGPPGEVVPAYGREPDAQPRPTVGAGLAGAAPGAAS